MDMSGDVRAGGVEVRGRTSARRGRHACGGGHAGQFAASAAARGINALVPVHQRSLPCQSQRCNLVTGSARDNL